MKKEPGEETTHGSLLESSLKAIAAVIVKDGMGAILTYLLLLLLTVESDFSCLQATAIKGGTFNFDGCGDDGGGDFLHEFKESW